MPERPKGILSLTYHLVHDNSVTQRWIDPNNYPELFEEFGITESQAKTLIEINGLIKNKKDVSYVVNAWIEMLRPELTAARWSRW